MHSVKKIKIGKKRISAYCILLQAKKFIVLRGEKGYIMCGYLNLSVANRFGDVAVKITGVSTIDEALKAKVQGVSRAAEKIGIYKGQPVRKVLSIIG
jgi:uncharacterized protein YunC (DUF1805 family)